MKTLNWKQVDDVWFTKGNNEYLFEKSGRVFKTQDAHLYDAFDNLWENGITTEDDKNLYSFVIDKILLSERFAELGMYEKDYFG